KIPVLEHRGAVLNLHDATLHYQDKQLDLTKNEFRILQMLLEQKGKIVSRDALMIRLWQMDCYVEENTLTVNVTRLRKKLDSIGLTGFIRTKVGSGYLIE
ncbi:MAG: winged helix-turn-helix domain-containing protein, partial [Oscillospiraceae bacterium]|nr:winged helix-turn-helix domain-containing protein [Oscillospiraceae bacterium]